MPKGLLQYRSAGTRAQATPTAVAVRNGCRGSRASDSRLCPCQMRAGGLCTMRGKAPLVICSGVAGRRGLPYGGSTRFMGVQLGGKAHLGRFGGCGCGAGTCEQQREAVTVLP